MTRFDLDMDGSMEPTEHGRWVRYEDVAEALAAQQAQQYNATSDHRLMDMPAQQEPVAWMYDWVCDGKLLEGWIAHKESEIPRSLASNMRPLYTSPPAQRKPLSVEEMFEAIRPLYSSDKAAWLAVNHSKDEYRAIEAAHGIKGDA